jgi:hypothetical protein
VKSESKCKKQDHSTKQGTESIKHTCLRNVFIVGPPNSNFNAFKISASMPKTFNQTKKQNAIQN